jgi:ABC-type glycerol-3-phosphate transport system substrate-binding protein
MDAQNQAGFLKDITTEAAPFEENLAQTAVNAFKVDGKTVGIPFDTGLVAFYYNKDLFKKAGVNAEAIKTWDDFLGAVSALKAAGRRSSMAAAISGRCTSIIRISSCGLGARTRWPTPKPEKTAASRTAPSSRRASVYEISLRSSRSSQAI